MRDWYNAGKNQFLRIWPLQNIKLCLAYHSQRIKEDMNPYVKGCHKNLTAAFPPSVHSASPQKRTRAEEKNLNPVCNTSTRLQK
mmetsp:Transcript_92268/g.154808  ORF Transcript_92268/g.154808 Transcript_92268/m.154808 type:complete len:84 (-) Transcript_92268:2135-2386(-)